MGVDESEGDGTTTAEAAAAAEGNLALYREYYEEPGDDWEGSGNWNRPGKKDGEEGRKEEERCTWIDPVGGKEIEGNPWRRSDLVQRPPFIVVLGWIWILDFIALRQNRGLYIFVSRWGNRVVEIRGKAVLLGKFEYTDVVFLYRKNTFLIPRVWVKLHFHF